jgi:hypothetical protein
MSSVVATLERTGRLRAALVAYGLVVAILGTTLWVLALPNASVALQSSRQAGISGSVAALDHGAPPLVVENGGSYQAANQGDDLGIYLVLGELGHLTGTRDAVTLFKDFSAAAMGLLVVLAPLAAFLLLESMLLALLAPLALLASFPFLANRDIYFTNAWIVLFGIPIAWLVLERGWRPRLVLPLLAAASLAAGCCNAIRAHSATGVGIALLVAALAQQGGPRVRLTAAALVVVCYAAVDPLAITAIQRHAFSQAHVSTNGLATAHSLWHPTYLGLGYLPNGWGIRWSDRIGEETVQRIDPSAAYLSPRYDAILRHRYFSIVGHHPFWAARLYLIKTAALIWDAVKHGGVLALLVPAAFLLGRDRRRLRNRLLLLLPPLGVAVVPPLLTIPSGYDAGVIACLDLAGAAALGSLLHGDRATARRPALVATAILIAVVLASALTTHVFASQVARQLGG